MFIVVSVIAGALDRVVTFDTVEEAETFWTEHVEDLCPMDDDAWMCDEKGHIHKQLGEDE